MNLKRVCFTFIGNNMKLYDYFLKFISLTAMPSNRHKTLEELYEELEQIHIEKTGKRKCKDYASFRSLKSQYYKMNRP